jgi:Flp pilus assembly protein TadD
MRRWWLDPPESDTVRRTLHEHFATVRDYRSLLVLERTQDASLRAFSELHRRAARRAPVPDDPALLVRLVASLPDEPLPASLLGALLLRTGESERGVALLERAVALDPGNPEPLEWLARFYLQASRPDSARDVVRRASSVRDSPALRELRDSLP